MSASAATPMAPNMAVSQLRKFGDLLDALKKLGAELGTEEATLLKLYATRELVAIAGLISGYVARGRLAHAGSDHPDALSRSDSYEVKKWLARPWTSDDSDALAAAKRAVPDHQAIIDAAEAAVEAGRVYEFARVVAILAEVARRRPGLFGEYSAPALAALIGFGVEGVELVLRSFTWDHPASQALALTRYGAGRLAAGGVTVGGVAAAIVSALDHAGPVDLDNVGLVFGPASNDPEVLERRAALAAESLAYSVSIDQAYKAARRGEGHGEGLEDCRTQYYKELDELIGLLNVLHGDGAPDAELAPLLVEIESLKEQSRKLESLIAGRPDD